MIMVTYNFLRNNYWLSDFNGFWNKVDSVLESSDGLAFRVVKESELFQQNNLLNTDGTTKFGTYSPPAYRRGNTNTPNTNKKDPDSPSWDQIIRTVRKDSHPSTELDAALLRRNSVGPSVYSDIMSERKKSEENTEATNTEALKRLSHNSLNNNDHPSASSADLQSCYDNYETGTEKTYLTA